MLSIWHIRAHRNCLNCLCLIYFTTVFSYSLSFGIFVGPMISRQNKMFLTTHCRHNSPTVTDICNITIILNKQHYNGARSRFIKSTWYSSIHCIIAFCHLKELSLSRNTSICESLCWIRWKAFLIDNNTMEAFFQKVSASTSTMTIINCKIRTFRPFICWNLFPLRSSHI